MQTVYHGVASTLKIADPKDPLFRGIETPIEVGRYHSWVIDPGSLPPEFTVTAVDNSGNIMGIHHKQLDVQGVQFHPESILTPCGEKMLRNWLSG
jgi:anthranilate synthase component 2